MIPSAESIRVMRPLFQGVEGGSIPTSALQLWLEPMGFEAALRLNEIWHSRLPRMGTGFIRRQPFLCYGAQYKGIAYAVAIWSNPVARNLPQQGWRESMKPPLLDRCIEAMKKHGPCTQTQLAKHTGSTPGSISTIICMLKARGVVKHRNGRDPAIYSLPGTIVKRADIPIFNEQKPDALKRGAELGKITPPKGHGPAAQSRSRNGAAGPALFGQALKALRDERAELLDQAEKLDRAIEAIEALA